MYQEYAKIFKAFADEKRLSILKMLHHEELCACKIQEHLQIGQSTLSHHMKILCDAGVVRGRREGKWIHYSIHLSGSIYAVRLLEEMLGIKKEVGIYAT
ncbi:MAG: ArsR/SmtB family transcription factor [Christensenellaceae bacterium]|jgi:ArsR family transcriptional regulator